MPDHVEWAVRSTETGPDLVTGATAPTAGTGTRAWAAVLTLPAAIAAGAAWGLAYRGVDAAGNTEAWNWTPYVLAATVATPALWQHTSEVAAPTDEWTSVTDPQGYIALSTNPEAVHQGAKGVAITATGTLAEATLNKTGLVVDGDRWSYELWVKIASDFALSETWRDFQFVTVSTGTSDIIRVLLTAASPAGFRIDRTAPSYSRFGNNVGSFSRDVWTKLRVEGSGHGTLAGRLAVYSDDVLVAEQTGIDFTSVLPANMGVKIGPHGGTGTSMTGTIFVDDGTFDGSASTVTPDPEPEPEQLDYADEAAVAASWSTAWNSNDEATLNSWFLAHTGPRIPTTGTHPGGTITTQAQADALAGMQVGDVLFKGPSGTVLRPRDAHFMGRVDYDWNTETDVQHCTIDGNDQAAHASHHYVKGVVTFRHNRIRKAQDGFKTATIASVPSFEYNLIHEPSPNVGALTGNATHQDAIQIMGGDFRGRRSFIDYEGNHSGGQGIIVKADSSTITHFELTETFVRAGGNNLTFEATQHGHAQTVVLGTGDTRNRFSPAANMINVISLYANPPSGHTLPQPFLDAVNAQSFFVGGSDWSSLNYVNGIGRDDLLAVAAASPAPAVVVTEPPPVVTPTEPGALVYDRSMYPQAGSALGDWRTWDKAYWLPAGSTYPVPPDVFAFYGAAPHWSTIKNKKLRIKCPEVFVNPEVHPVIANGSAVIHGFRVKWTHWEMVTPLTNPDGSTKPMRLGSNDSATHPNFHNSVFLNWSGSAEPVAVPEFRAIENGGMLPADDGFVYLGEFLNYDRRAETGDTFVIQNMRCANADTTQGLSHVNLPALGAHFQGDLYQPIAGPERMYVIGMVGVSTYQGIFDQARVTGSTKHFERVYLRGDRGDADRVGGSAYMWWDNSRKDPTTTRSWGTGADGVYVDPNNGSRDTLWDHTVYPDAYTGVVIGAPPRDFVPLSAISEIDLTNDPDGDAWDF